MVFCKYQIVDVLIRSVPAYYSLNSLTCLILNTNIMQRVARRHSSKISLESRLY